MRSSTEQLALVRGWDDTRTTLRHWRAAPQPRCCPWVRASFGVAVLLLTATWLVAAATTPDPMNFARTGTGNLHDFGYILYRNGLVLALHAMACVAGFMAGSSLPVVAEGHTGWRRRVHDHAGRLAMGFVAAATLFSLTTQAYALGITAVRPGRRARHVARPADRRHARRTPSPSSARSSSRSRPGSSPAGARPGTAAGRDVRHDRRRSPRPGGRRGRRGVGVARTYYPF